MFLLLLTCASGWCTETVTAKRPEYCLFVTVDGLDRDYVARGDAPNMLAWQNEGTSFPDAINVYPTLTTPNMTSLLTGAYPATTTIGANTVWLKDQRKVVSAPRFNKATTIAEVFHEAGLPTASVQHFMLEQRGADKYQHVEGTSHDITTQAIAFLNEKPTPKLLAVLWQTVDKMGHLYGANSKEVSAECRAIDAEIKQVVETYRELGILDKTVVAITSDHGMSDKNKQIDLKALNEAITHGGWKYARLLEIGGPPPTDVDFYYIQLGNMQCYFNRPFSIEERERLFAAIRSVEGVGTILNETMLRRMHTHPNAGDFIVESAPGWWFGGGGGIHGRNTESDGYLMMFGAGIRRGAVATGAKTIDVVPTLLHLMNLPIPHTVDGKVLWNAIE
jgi:arylsulfatase A-like enzyme